MLVSVGHNQAGIHRKALSANETSRNAPAHNTLASRNHKLTKGVGISLVARHSERFPWPPLLQGYGPKKLSAAASFKRLEGRRTELMTNKSHAITISLFRIGVLAAQIAVSPSAAAQSTAGAASQQPALMDREREIALALSACPSFVMSKAAVYVLEKSGYVKIRDTENGFSAIVQHSLPTAQEPRCMDAEGTRTHLPRILKVAELRAQGKSREEIQRFVADAFAKGIFQPPSRPGVDYMLSTENLVPNAKGVVVPFPPHVMFYAPYLTNAELGVDRTDLGPDGNPHAAAFVAGEGTPHALIIVPVALHTGPGHPVGNTPQ